MWWHIVPILASQGNIRMLLLEMGGFLQRQYPGVPFTVCVSGEGEHACVHTCVHMSMCMHVVCGCVHTYLHEHVCMCVYEHACVRACMNYTHGTWTCVHSCVHMSMHMHSVCGRVCIHVCTCVCKSMHVCTCVYRSMHGCIHVCAWGSEAVFWALILTLPQRAMTLGNCFNFPVPQFSHP